MAKQVADVTIWYPNGESEDFKGVPAESEAGSIFWWTNREKHESIAFSGLPFRAIYRDESA